MTNPFSVKERKIDPSRYARRPDGSPEDNDRPEIGPTQLAFSEWQRRGITPPNLEQLRSYRKQRMLDRLQELDYAAVLLFDPVNIRYTTDASNMQVWTLHNLERACLLTASGYCVLWDFQNCDHLCTHLNQIDEVRSGAGFTYFEYADRTSEKATHFARQVDDLMRSHCGNNRRLAVDKMEICGLEELRKLGVVIGEGQEITEIARSVKDANEINALRCAIAACEEAIAEMRVQLRPGISEAELWSHLHAGNIKRGGEWIETRLMSSGPRTNPWFQECGPRVIEEGDIVAFDTDMISTYGYCCDMSRTWLCGDGKPSAEQKRLYKIAHENIQHNIGILRPGMSFREISERAFELPPEFKKRRYSHMLHGIGLCDEYPSIRYPEDFEDHGYMGYTQVGMTLSVESYIGSEHGGEGIKLEEQIAITDTGCEVLTSYPFESRFLD